MKTLYVDNGDENLFISFDVHW